MRYKILWTEARAIFQGLKRNESRVMLGICGLSKRVFQFAAKGIVPLAVSDLYADPEKGTCEEAYQCFDFDCPLNKTTWESLHLKGKKPEGFGTTMKWNRDGAFLADFVKEHPNAGTVECGSE